MAKNTTRTRAVHQTGRRKRKDGGVGAIKQRDLTEVVSPHDLKIPNYASSTSSLHAGRNLQHARTLARCVHFPHTTAVRRTYRSTTTTTTAAATTTTDTTAAATTTATAAT